VDAVREIIEQWKLQFRKSDLVDLREGKLKLNYLKARNIYYGSVSEGRAQQGFQQIFSDSGILHAKADAKKIERAAKLSIVYLAQMGISIPANENLIQHHAEEILQATNHVFRNLSHPRHQHSFDIDNPFTEIREEVQQLAKIALDENEGEPKEKKDNQFNNYITLPENYLDDPFVRDLFARIESSSENFFITGKAGTGKSTFLHYLARNSKKNIVIAAYTGIAAINVGGTTLNSLLQIPFRPLLPRDEEITRFGPTNARRKVLANMDTLIIDEVSMVRADILEAVDHSLRINGGDPSRPFGGKQIILIGDVFQLPPVVKTEQTEWDIFSEVYKTPYFFSAPSFRLTTFNFVEFAKIHRQTDEDFKEVLNKIRVGNVNEDDLRIINKRVFGNYEPRPQDFVLTLVTTNKLASEINDRKLNEIAEQEYAYEAKIEKDFSKDKFPTDQILRLKKGTQIIFIKNDATNESGKDVQKRRWVNGTIAKIHALKADEIEVQLENGSIHKIAPETWENKVYKWNRAERKVTSETVGTFTQFPMKLAWAITIHKSQGLTFNKMMLNTGWGAFAHGQTYVALSRCRTLDGLVLKKPIRKTDIIIDDRVMDFYRDHFTFNEDYKESQKNLEFILHNSEFFLKLISIHYSFNEEQKFRYKSLLDFDLKFDAEMQNNHRNYYKLSITEIEELIERDKEVMYSKSFWSNNFSRLLDSSMIETVLDYLLELDKLVSEKEEEG
jgi:DNA replication protein DnaC